MPGQDRETRIDYVPLDEVRRWPRNPKGHDEAGLEASVERFGFVEPLILDERTGQLVAGHGRLAVLAAMGAAHKGPPAGIRVAADGRWCVPVVRGIAFANGREAEAYLLASNRLCEAGGWDEKALAEMLADVAREAPGLDGVGWTAGELERMQGALGGSNDGDEGAEGNDGEHGYTPGQRFSVIVDFDNEREQGALLRELEARGLAVRLMIS